MASVKESLNELDVLTARYEAEFRRVAAEHLRDYVESVTNAVPQFGPDAYVCPCCKSGTGVNGHYTPAFHLFRRQDGRMAFKCHACDVSGDIFALAGLVEGAPAYEEQRRIVARFLGVDLSRRTPLENLQAPDAKAPRSCGQGERASLRQKARAYIAECREHAGETSFFTARGLSPDIVKRFNLGYDPKARMAVIPFNGTYYVGRSTRIGHDRKGAFKHYNPHGLRQPLFNMAALSSPAVFVTEAPLDALSIVQSGGAAVALGGTSVAEFARLLQVYRPEACFVLALDNDEPGRRARTRLANMLGGMGCSFVEPEHPAFLDYKDANAALMANPELLREGVSMETSRALANLALDRAAARRTEKESLRMPPARPLAASPSLSPSRPLSRIPQNDLSAAKREAARTAAVKNAARRHVLNNRNQVQEAR